MRDVVVGRATEKIDPVDEERDPEGKQEQEECEFSTTGEMVEILTA